jgi:hypothetical protein
VQVRALEHRDAFALQVFELRDLRVGRHAQVQAVAHAAGDDDFRLDAAGAVHDGGQVALPCEVELVIDERLVDRRARALEEDPLDLDAVFLELLLEQALGVGDADARAAGSRRRADAAGGDADANRRRCCLCDGSSRGRDQEQGGGDPANGFHDLLFKVFEFDWQRRSMSRSLRGETIVARAACVNAAFLVCLCAIGLRETRWRIGPTRRCHSRRLCSCA